MDTRADRVAAGRAEKLSVKEGDETVATEAFVAKQEELPELFYKTNSLQISYLL